MGAHKSSDMANLPHLPNSAFVPVTEAENELVRAQLGRILSGPAFQNSKRYAAVLKFILEQTLEGEGERLKERTIGIEVFNRAPDYDTATDHAVRSAATEIRKRLGQYYAANRGELGIEIQPGSYIAQFRWPEEWTPPAPPHLPASQAKTPEPAAALAAAGPLATTRAPTRLRWVWWLIAATAVGVAAIVFAVTHTTRRDDPMTSFWKPIVSSSGPVLLCIGNVEGGEFTAPAHPGLSPNLTLGEFHNSPASTVDAYDAFTLARFAALLQSYGRSFRFASQSDATFTDLQNGPSVLVGLLNNSWTERLMPKLRYTVERPTTNTVVIVDRNNPANQNWSVDYSTPYLKLTRDYALVLRMVDPKTEQPVVMDAGITVFGTQAAAMFLTNPTEMKKLAALAPPGWDKKNMEIVMATDVIQGRSGPATILAVQFW